MTVAESAAEAAPALDRPAAPASPGILPAGSRERWLVAAILVIALVLRVGLALAIHHSYVPKNDAANFDSIARSLSSGHGFGKALVPPSVGKTAFRAPLYPLVLAAAYLVFGHSPTVGLLQNAVIGVWLVAMIGVVASLLWGRRVALVALVVAALHPTLMLFGTSLQLEPMLAALALAALAAALQYRRTQGQTRWLVAAGVLVGLAILTREVGIALLPPVAWLIWTTNRRPETQSRRRSLRPLAAPAAAVVLSVLVVAPWTIRNAVELHAFVPVTTTGGIGLAGTYNQTSYNNTTYPAIWVPAYYDPAINRTILANPDRSEVQLDKEYRRAAIDFVKNHPGYLPKVLFWNTVRMFDFRGSADAVFTAQYIPYPHSLTVLSVFASYVLELLAVAALFLPMTRRAPKSVWLFPVLACLIILVLSGNIRYRASIEPFTVLLASVTLARILAWYGVGSRSRRTTGDSVVASVSAGGTA
jgi:4-amino-4-deoxy-L-arabinose transferase-like glycosyltransferase